MKPRTELVQEILDGLEGLETLGQWEASLVEDIRTKAAALLKHEEGGESGESQDR